MWAMCTMHSAASNWILRNDFAAAYHVDDFALAPAERRLFDALNHNQVRFIILGIDDVDVFSTVEEAEGYLEPFMVPNLRVWDADGHLLSPVVVKRFLARVVRLEEPEHPQSDFAGLRSALVRLIRGNESLDIEGLNRLPPWFVSGESANPDGSRIPHPGSR